MSMNKLGLGRFKTWAGGVMSGSDARSNMSEDMQRDLEEMDARTAGVDRMDRAMRTYLKYLSKRVPGDNKDTPYPSAHLGASMIRQGDEMPRDSELGGRLAKFGQLNVRIASFQEQYGQDATASWQQALERSLAQMKDYQGARKMLELRRKEYDAVCARIAKAKREDPAIDEELRKKTALYEESQRDVLRRIQDIRDAEEEDMDALDRFLDAELVFHESCMNALQRLKSDWSARGLPHRNTASSSSSRLAPSGGRSRSNTMRSPSYATLNEAEEYADDGYAGVGATATAAAAPSVRPGLGTYKRTNSYSYSHDESPTDSYGYQSKSSSHSQSPDAALMKSYRSPGSGAGGSSFEGPTTSARRVSSSAAMGGAYHNEDSYFPPSGAGAAYRDRDRERVAYDAAAAAAAGGAGAPSLPLRPKRSQTYLSASSHGEYDSLEDTPAYRPRTPSVSSPAASASPFGSDGPVQSRMGGAVGASVNGKKGPPPPPPRSKKPPPPLPKKGQRLASYAD
ncbi:hypothetical protein KEM52_001245 [Ascosphaera acerosa]|nr:hypothetical protein KEM52_001245 [Ascosphaera acerosa]